MTTPIYVWSTSTPTGEAPVINPLSADRAVELLAEVVAERGESYVYVNRYGVLAGAPQPGAAMTACQYVHVDTEGQPICGCLVAHVMVRHGVPIEWLMPYENTQAEVFLADVGWATWEAAELLGIAQNTQDRGCTWGAALSAVRSARCAQIARAAKADEDDDDDMEVAA